MAIDLGSTILSEILVIIGIFLVIFIIFKLGKLLIGLLANIILGFIALFAINVLFGLAIPFDLPVIIITALLGLPGVAVIVILRLLGITL